MVVACLILLGGSSVSKAQSKLDTFNYPFELGEKLTYSMYYGWFEIGTADVSIDESLWELDGQPHFYVQCQVHTNGFFSFFSKLDVCMDSWINVKTLRPNISFRDVVFGKRIDVRTDSFVYSDSVSIRTYVEDVDSRRFHIFPKTDTMLLDVLSTYLYLRSLDLANSTRNQFYPVRTFFSNDLYDFGMIYSAQETYDWKDQSGVIKRYDLIFPEVIEFPSGNQAYVLATDDDEKIPVLILIQMKYGDFEFRLKHIE